MKLLYIVNARIPTEKAHGIAVMKMCEAFAKQGLEVELVVPRRFNEIKEDPFTYYGVEKNFSIKKLFVIDLMHWLGKVGFLIEALVFAEMAFWYGLFSKADIIYGRDELSLSHLSLFKKNVVWEAHTAKSRWLVGGLLKRCKVLVVISRGLMNYYTSLGAPEEKLLVAPSGVDVSKFEIKNSKSELRERLGLPQDKKIVMYVGHTYTWKGVDTLKEASKLLPEDVQVVFVSGKKHSEIPAYLKAADLLVLPNSGKEDVSRLHTSPMKLFEYMASGTPMVVSDLPSMREVLDDSMAYFFKPDDSESLKEVIIRALDSNGLGKDNAEKVKEYSWSKRSEKIIEFIK